MARYVFGGKIEDFAFGTSSGAVTALPSGIVTTFWTAQTGGSQITDLEDMSNNPITTVGTIANGYLPQFQGPDTGGASAAHAGQMWAQLGSSPRVQMFGALDPAALPSTYVAIADLEAALANIVYLSPTGNDSTAIVGNQAKPFASLTAAVAALPVSLSAPSMISADSGAYANEPGAVALAARTNLSIFCNGVGGDAAKFTTTGTGSSLTSTFPINSSNRASIYLTGIKISNANSSNTGAGIEQRGGTSFYMERVEVAGHLYGTILDQTEIADLKNCNMNNQLAGGAGYWLTNGSDRTPSASTNYTNRITIQGGEVTQGSSTVGIIDDGGWSHIFQGINFQGCSNQIIQGGTSGAIISGCEMEGAGAAPIRLRNVTYNSSTVTSGVLGLTITGCTADTSTSGLPNVLCEAGVSVSITANSFASTGYAVTGTSTLSNLFSQGNFNQRSGNIYDSFATNHIAFDGGTGYTHDLRIATNLGVFGASGSGQSSNAELFASLRGWGFYPSGAAAVAINMQGGVLTSTVTSGAKVLYDLGGGSAPATGGDTLAAYGLGRGDPGSVGTTMIRGGVADTSGHGVDVFVNGQSAVTVRGNGTSGNATIGLSDGRNISVGTSTGTKVGTSTSQKLGFWGATPVVQPTGSVDLLANLRTIGILPSGGAGSASVPLDLGGGVLKTKAPGSGASVLIDVGNATAATGGDTLAAYGIGRGDAGSVGTTLVRGGTGDGGAHGVDTYVNGQSAVNIRGNGTSGNATVTLSDGRNFVFGTSTGTQIGTGSTQKIGFYGATPIVRATRPGQLTDSSGGSATGTIADVGAAFSQSGLNNIHASLIAKINAMETAIHNLGLVS